MKKVFCFYKDCDKRRSHFTAQDEYRPRQMVEVRDEYDGSPVYCSFTCAILDGKMSVRNYKHKKENCVSYQEGGLPCEDCE